MKHTIQSNQITLSKINLANIYEKRLLNTFIDSLSPYLKSKIEEVKKEKKGLHTEEKHEFAYTNFESIIYTYNLSDVEPNAQNYNRLRSAIKKLRETSIDIITPDGSELYTGLIESASLSPLSETFKVRLSVTAYQFLCDLSKGYSIKSFKTALELKTIYSSCIYELLCKWRNKPVFQIDIEELKFITNCPKSYSSNDFKKRVLDSAKKELDNSEVTDLTFTYKNIKKGRSISGFKIFIHHTKNDSLEVNKLSKQTSPKWDFDKEIIQFLNRNKINFNGANRQLLMQFFKLNGVNKGLELLENIKDLALRTSRNNPQGYIISAVKINIKQISEKKEEVRQKNNSSNQDSQTNIITQLAELTKRKTV